MAMSWLNYHHLYYFRVIANEGTVAKAAKKLRLGQPTLSKQLAQLESSIGHRLFDRRSKRLHLTEAGKVTLDYANEIFRLGEELQGVLADKLPTDKLQIQVGAMDSVPKHFVLKLIQTAQQLGNCSVSIVEGRGDELIREIRAHRIDLIVSNYAPSVTEASGLYAKLIARMPVVVCGDKKFVGLKKGFPASLDGQPFVMPTVHSRLRHDVEHYFKLNQIHPNVVIEVQDTSLQKLFGVKGTGLIPIASEAVTELADSKELTVIGELPSVYEELWLIAAERRLQNPVAAHLMKQFSL
jgi:LysR family transcriptional activator of nhaA